MAAGTKIYTQADTGNLNKYITDKIKAARQMAAEERAYSKENQPDVKTEDGYFFGKALVSQFGGDRLARTRGMFSSNPSDTQDPSLSSKERFQNLVRGEVSSTPLTVQPVIPGMEDIASPQVTQGKKLESWLSVALKNIANNNQKIANAINQLGNQNSEESVEQDTQNKSLGKLFGVINSLKQFLKKNNDLEEKEVEMVQAELDLTKDMADDAKIAEGELKLEGIKDSASVNMLDKEQPEDSAKKENNGGLLGRLFDGFDIGLRRRRRRKPGARRRLARRRFRRMFGGGGRRGALGLITSGLGMAAPFMGGGVDNPTQKNSEGTAPRKYAFGGAPLFPSGIYDNPTVGTLQPNQGVVPLNRNNPFSDLFKRVENKNKKKGKQQTTPKKDAEMLHKAIQLPAIAGGSFLISSLTQILNKGFGGTILSSILNPIVKPLFRPIANFFGLPANITGAVAEGEAAQQSGEKESSVGTSLATRGLSSKNGKKGGLLSSLGSSFKRGLKGLFNSLNPFAPPSSRPRNPGRPGSLNVGQSMRARGGGLPSRNIHSPFGWRESTQSNHMGLDISGGEFVQGAAISVIKPGEVVAVEDHGNESWGKHVVIKHHDGTYSLYGHLDEVNVRVGEKIENKSGAAKVIGKLGNTGESTGPHLHFEVGSGWNGVIKDPVDPAPYIDSYVRGGGKVEVDAMQVSLPGSPSNDPLGLNGLNDPLGINANLPFSNPGTSLPSPSKMTPTQQQQAAAQFFIQGMRSQQGQAGKPLKQNTYLNPSGGATGLTLNPVLQNVYGGVKW